MLAGLLRSRNSAKSESSGDCSEFKVVSLVPATGGQHGAAPGGIERFLFLRIVYLRGDLSGPDAETAGFLEGVTNMFFTLFVLRNGKCSLWMSVHPVP